MFRKKIKSHLTPATLNLVKNEIQLLSATPMQYATPNTYTNNLFYSDAVIQIDALLNLRRQQLSILTKIIENESITLHERDTILQLSRLKHVAELQNFPCRKEACCIIS